MLFAQSYLDAKKMLQQFIQFSAEYGLQVHASKTKVLSWEQFSLGRTTIHIEDNVFSILTEGESERYLGRKLCLQDCQQVELKHRIAAGWAKFQSFKEELTSKSYAVAARLRLFEAAITSTILYGACTWALTQTMARDLDIVRRKMLRRVLRLFWQRDAERWQDYLTRVARKIEDADARWKLVPWSVQAKARKWHFAGNLVRLTDDRWSHLILDWHPVHGTRNVGRPYTRWVDDIVDYAGGDWRSLALCQEDWEAHCSGFVASSMI